MDVLIACEESQAVCIEFRLLGHNAFSCDIQNCTGGHPEWHIKGDVLPLLDGFCSFTTLDGCIHFLNKKWDLIIAHPPCTFLTVAGACNIPSDKSRITKGHLAREFFMRFLNCNCDKVLVENPIPMRQFNLPPCSQIVYPYYFGDCNNKPLCLWLKGLPPLICSDFVDRDRDYIIYFDKYGNKRSVSRWYSNSGGVNHSKKRSKTFPGFAKAIANQYGGGLFSQVQFF